MPPAPPVPHFVDLSDRTKLRVRGADAARYLQGQLTNDVRRASTEVALYACVLTAKGRLVADVFLRAEPDGVFLLDADASLREPLAERLGRYIIADDVEVEDVTDDFGLLHLAGDVPITSSNAAACGVPAPARAERFGALGTDVFFPVGDALDGFKELLRNLRCREESADDAETRRITAGVPRWGAELDADTLPPEAGLETRAISYEKGCYVGQETVSRLKSVGHVNRHLRRLRALGPDPLGAGLVLHEPAGTLPGREVGRLTSVAGALALGYVRRGLDAAGTRLLALDPADPAAAPRVVEVLGSLHGNDES